MRYNWEWKEEDANGNGWNELGTALVLLVFNEVLRFSD